MGERASRILIDNKGQKIIIGRVISPAFPLTHRGFNLSLLRGRLVFLREGRSRFVGKYPLLPFSDSVLAAVFYFVVHNGFSSPEAGFAETSPFGFATLAAMVGRFSEQAVSKLKEISETLLSKPAEGKNAEPQGSKS